ncbi:MAG: hydrogenase maturation protease [Bacteroidota bacterium]
MKIVIIGIGQSMRGDDAAGLEAVRRWREVCLDTASRSEVTIEASGLPGLGLLDLLSGVDAAVLVDAVHGSAPAGTIHRLDPSELSAFESGASSAHGWGVAETLALAEELNLPHRDVTVRIVGIEAGSFGPGQQISPEVEQALPAACEAIELEVLSLLKAEDERAAHFG